MNQDPRNSTFQMVSAFEKQMVLHHTQPEQDQVQAAKSYLDRHAPDLIGMVLGAHL